ncbi:MAG: NUMOD3 domain-containing DNA-binding protein [Eubacteriales bacterium]|nr:NUMOD3 domain-containing DNA-binding protein [Eubacteriales bacterium]
MQTSNSTPYGYIYKITNPVNNKCYIGQTTNTPKERWYCYKNLNCKDQPKLYNALKKYGSDTFVYEIFDDTASDQEELDFLEESYMLCFNSRENGYNIKEGGSRGKHSPETCKKKSEALKEWYRIHGTEMKKGKNNPMYGKTHTEKVIELSRKRNTGKKLSQKHYLALLSSHTGTHHSEETKQKIKLANIGKKHTEETKLKISQTKLNQYKPNIQ